MRLLTKWWFWVLVGGCLIYLLRKKLAMWYEVTAQFIQNEEGFSPTPYWDVKRWSWGYGTRVPNSVDDKNVRPLVKITKAEAIFAAMKHIQNDFVSLGLKSLNLSPKQVAAILSFTYNLGTGNGQKLVSKIKTNSLTETYWLSFNKSGKPLAVNPNLTARRKREYDLFTTGA